MKTRCPRAKRRTRARGVQLATLAQVAHVLFLEDTDDVITREADRALLDMIIAFDSGLVAQGMLKAENVFMVMERRTPAG